MNDTQIKRQNVNHLDCLASDPNYTVCFLKCVFVDCAILTKQEKSIIDAKYKFIHDHVRRWHQARTAKPNSKPIISTGKDFFGPTKLSKLDTVVIGKRGQVPKAAPDNLTDILNLIEEHELVIPIIELASGPMIKLQEKPRDD